MKRYVVSVQISDIFVNIIFSFQPKYTQLHLLFIQFASLFRDPRLTKEFSVNCYSWNEQETYLRMQRYFHQRSSFYLFLSRIPTCRYLHATTVNTLTIWMFLANKTFTQRVTVCFVFFLFNYWSSSRGKGPGSSSINQSYSRWRSNISALPYDRISLRRLRLHESQLCPCVHVAPFVRNLSLMSTTDRFLASKTPLPSEWLWQKLVEPLEPKPTTQSLSAC